MKYLNMIKDAKWLVMTSLVVGIAFGLLWGWVIQPVEWTDGDPTVLAQQYQEDYLRMAIDSFRVNAQQDLAKSRVANLGENANGLFEQIKANPGTIDKNFLLLFESAIIGNTQPQTDAGTSPEATKLPDQAQSGSQSASTDYSWLGSVGLILGIVIAIGAVAVALFFYIRRRQQEQFDEDEDYEDGYDQNDEYNFRSSESTSGQSNEAWQGSSQMQQPFARFQSTYVIGDDGFNESFSIDSRGGEFLGDCGFGISEFIGVGVPKKATALEVWMFDKNDIQTVTKVLMSPFAYKDPGYRGRLEAKGELIEIQPHKQIKLETATLFMIATVADVSFGQGMTADPSHVEQITLDLSIWQK